MAEALGVEPCFVAPTWVEITAGQLGRALGSVVRVGTIEAGRMEALYMTQPYYVIPAYAFVPEGSPVKRPRDLAGKRVGACAAAP